MNISDVFYEIINSLVNPINVLFNPNDEDRMLNENEGGANYNPNYINALKRIFRIFDKDSKGIITKSEFLKIHKQIFDKDLESDHFEALKELIKSINSNSYSILLDNEIDQQGFIAINQAAVNIQEAQITWSILRKYGYNDLLVFDETYLLKICKLEKINTNDWIVEISDIALGLLTQIFTQYGKKVERNGKETMVITEIEWGTIFSPCCSEYGLNFKGVIKTYKLNKTELTLDDWYFIWSCITRINYQNSYLTFLYIGFELDFKTFVKVINKSTINILNPLVQKTIFVSLVGEKYDEFGIFQNYLIGLNGDTTSNINQEDNRNVDNIVNDNKQNIDTYFYLSFKGITYIVLL